MVKLIHVLFLALPSLALACHSQFQPSDIAGMKAYMNEPENGLLKRAQAPPFLVSVQYLPAAYLQQVQNTSATADAPDAKTGTFQLRISGLNDGIGAARLIQQQAPASWTASQQRNALFYGFEEVCTLQLGNQVVRPLFATVEMTAQTQREISVVVVFPLTVDQLHKHKAVHFKMSPTYFLKRSLTLPFNTTDLLAVYPQKAVAIL